MLEGNTRYIIGEAAAPIGTRTTYMLASGRSSTTETKVAALFAPEAAAPVTLHDTTPVDDTDDAAGVSRKEFGGNVG